MQVIVRVSASALPEGGLLLKGTLGLLGTVLQGFELYKPWSLRSGFFFLNPCFRKGMFGTLKEGWVMGNNCRRLLFAGKMRSTGNGQPATRKNDNWDGACLKTETGG
jgi:hypothetical protein